MWNYEGPSYSAGTSSLSARQSFANQAYTQLDWTGTGSGGGGGGGTTPPSTDANKQLMTLWLVDALNGFK
jgi:hypothetical protein